MDAAEEWLVEERELAGGCPSCGAAEARPIVYGMPDLTFYERVDGRVAFYGCCLPEVLHRWRCGGCGHEWGERQAVGEPEDVEPT